jgi:hypothetical protein
MYQQLVEELKHRFDADVELNLSCSPQPVAFFEDRVRQFALGMSFISKYSGVINDENILDVMAQVRGEIIDQHRTSIAPHAFISALEDIGAAMERRMSYEVYKLIEVTRIDLLRLLTELPRKDMKRGCEYIHQMVDWIRSSNLHAELKSIEHALDSFYRQTIQLIPNNAQSGFLIGATKAIDILKLRWNSLSPLDIKPSCVVSHGEVCQWHRYSDATNLVRTYASTIERYKSSYLMLAGFADDEQLRKELRFFRSAKEDFVRLIDSDLCLIKSRLMSSRDKAIESVKNSPYLKDSEITSRIYYLNSVSEILINAAASIKPMLGPGDFTKNIMLAPNKKNRSSAKECNETSFYVN